MRSSKLLVLVTMLTFTVKLIDGYLTNSLVLTSDAGDHFSLILSWWTVKLASHKPTI